MLTQKAVRSVIRGTAAGVACALFTPRREVQHVLFAMVPYDVQLLVSSWLLSFGKQDPIRSNSFRLSNKPREGPLSIPRPLPFLAWYGGRQRRAECFLRSGPSSMC